MDFVPVCNPEYTWDADKKGIVTVHVVNKGFYNWIAQKIFKKPRISHMAVLYGSRWMENVMYMRFPDLYQSVLEKMQSRL